jgi:hypothetical protein
MENRTFIEAKDDTGRGGAHFGAVVFCKGEKNFFSVREDRAKVCLKERRKDFVRWVSLGELSSIFLVDTVEEALKSLGLDVFQVFSQRREDDIGSWGW